jgi:predicted short-subunit dehydrogenase-like oxidoreductase (DUF2520 family)
VRRTAHAPGQSIGIAGAGRLGPAIGRILYEAGEPLTAIASRTLEHARAAAAFIGSGVCALPYEQMHAERVLIAVPDDAIEHVAARLPGSPAIALHTSGARGADALKTLRDRGAACGVLHPLQTVPEPNAAMSLLRGVMFSVSGDPAAVAWAKQIADCAGGRTFEITDSARPLYHAAAVMASNYITAMLDAAASLMASAGAPSGEALNALAPLARASLENALRLGPAAALTGPIERGDAKTIAAHLAALPDSAGPLRQFYRAAALITLELARRRGLARQHAAEIEALLR